jgi:thiamine kinase-like enzyme
MLTYGTIRQATNTASVTSFLEERVLAGSEWHLVKVRRRVVRLDPPVSYTALYRVTLGSGELLEPEPASDAETADAEAAEPPERAWSKQRELHLVAKGVFDPAGWEDYAARLRDRFGDSLCEPLTGHGYPVYYPETQHVFWFYPIDGNLRTLAWCADRGRMLRLFRRIKREILDYPGRITDVRIDSARYLPEVTAIFRYEIETSPSAAGKTIYGKVQRAGRGAETNWLMEQIWAQALKSEGRLSVPKPLGYYPELDLFLQSAAAGEAITADRLRPEFKLSAVAAAEALAAIHNSGIRVDNQATLESELNRLDDVVEQFAYVHPKAHFMLREFLLHARNKLRKTRAEEWLPTHGDLKYDQLLHEGGRFQLIDFEYFTMAETSWDLGKYCAYAVPTEPKTWEHSVAAEEARKLFLDRYRELRPDATLDRFQLYESVNLALRAMVMMWGQRPDWMPAVESILSLAMERLNSRLP